MTEDFLQFYWKFKSKDKAFITSAGESVKVIRPGDQNPDAGPDFLNAMVEIAGTTWAGNVEVHSRSSEWYHHRHHLDESYDNVILHVVHKDDQSVKLRNGNMLPCLELDQFNQGSMYRLYIRYLSSPSWIPCSDDIRFVRDIVMRDCMGALCIERLEKRCHALRSAMDYYKHDWNQVYLLSICSAFGFSVNRQPFEMLARQTPYQVIAKHRDNLVQLEALFLGQAGFLEGRIRDSYPKLLSLEYLHLRNLYGLTPIKAYLWKFLRMRPNNFPTIRLVQLSGIFHRNPGMVTNSMKVQQPRDYQDMLRSEVSDYWKTHYLIDKPSGEKTRNMDIKTYDLIIINHFIPFLYFTGSMKQDEVIKQQAVDLLNSVPPEKNLITRKFVSSGVVSRSAADSQALLELKKEYCNRKRCLECRIGIELLK